MDRQKLRKMSVIIIGGGLVVFLLIQLIPYGKTLSNPPITGEPQWNNPQTKAIVKRACFDCHSNESVYPWYAYVAPSSWLLQFDIERARANMNFSEWSPDIDGGVMADAISRVVKEGIMPPVQYSLMHPEARLSATEKEQFISGIRDSLIKK